MDDDVLVRSTPDTLVTVQQVDDRIVATDLLAEEELWDQAKPLGDLYIYTTSKYAILVSNDRSHNAFSVVDLSTGEEHSHSSAWGDWSAGSAGSQGVCVTHRSLCTSSVREVPSIRRSLPLLPVCWQAFICAVAQFSK